MYKDNKIATVIPAYNEAGLIRDTLDGIPDFVDIIFVINDCSTDDTLDIIKELQVRDKRITIIEHKTNKGVGQSLIDGYLKSAESEAEVTVIMAGDNQMDPNDLPTLLDEIVDKDFDYVKGNRLLHSQVKEMPLYRFLGNSLLTILTKFATGYYFVMDPQCGYTAIKNSVLRSIPIHQMTKRYGYNADILTMLNIQGYSVSDVEVRPVYDREKSKIKLWKYIPNTSAILIRLIFKRLWKRYVVRDFHPLVLLLLFSGFNFWVIILPLSIRFFSQYLIHGSVPKTTALILFFTILITLQSLLFAVWMDMDYNKKKHS